MIPLLAVFDSEAAAIGQLVSTILMAAGILYGSLRKTARQDAAVNDARDRSIAAAYQKIHNQTLDRHAAEYARWTEERDSWREQMAQAIQRQEMLEQELENVRQENRDCVERDLRKDFELKQVKDEQTRIKGMLKTKGIDWDTQVFEVPPQLRQP